MDKIDGRKSEQFRENLRKKQTGSNNSFYNRKHSPESKMLMRQATIKMNGQRQYKLAEISIITPPVTILAYIAGIVDGEGSIGFKGSKKCPFISIYNTEESLMIFLKNNLGGNYRGKIPNKPNQKTHRINYMWQITAARDVHHLCNLLLPFLVIKKEKAQKTINQLQLKYSQLWIRQV